VHHYLNVVFVTTCKDRSHHVKETLPRNLADNPSARFVLINYNSGDDLRQYILENHAADLESGRLVMYSTYEPKRFQMAHAKNLAHRLGITEGADILCNLDADNYAGRGFATYLQQEFAEAIRHGREKFMWAKMIKGELARGINGRIACTRNAFLMAGGYDEKYNTWSPDDEDFKIRLKMLGCEHAEIHPRYLDAIRHPDKSRFKEYPEVAATAYGENSGCNPQSSIANFGKVGLAKVFRNGSKNPMDVPAIPTRIFGIGMHKTGTTSLDKAFRVLGFSALHWGTALKAREIWTDIQEDGHSGVIDGTSKDGKGAHYAFSDLPFPLIYEELDRAYPGSKFILTMRDEEKWLRSVEKHWDVKTNPNRAYWDIAPFTHKMHHLMYGQKTFDRATFAKRYRRHNRAVWEYFEKRPDDLLTFHLGDGWPGLCKFLKRPVPSVPYPHELATDSYRQDFQI
jgi:hypothetical protein